MDSPLISVIVPVYNVEKYLDRCVQSIVDQTYRNLEIILVDDGSPDNCPAMCDAWAKKDGRVRVLHKKNGGLSDARNAGMDVATGQFIGFVDSDDYIREDMYRLLMEHIISEESDIAACGVEMVYEDGSPARMMTASGCCVLDRTEAMEALLNETMLKHPVWNKVYKKELIRDLPFPVGKYHEDVYWSYLVLARANQISIFDVPCYYYMQRSGSIMAESYTPRRLDAIEAKQQQLDFLNREFPALADIGRKNLIFSCMYHGQLAKKSLHGQEQYQAIKYLNHCIKHCSLPSHAAQKQMPVTHRIWMHAAKLCFGGTCIVRNTLGIGL